MIGSDDGLNARFTLEDAKGTVVEQQAFRLLVLGDWTANAERGPLSDRQPIEIDRDNFDSVMHLLGPRLDVERPGSSPFSLEFHELDDFQPDNIFRKLPLFSQLRELRQKLLDPDTFNVAAGEVRSWMHLGGSEDENRRLEPRETLEPQDLLDRILSGPGGAATAPRKGSGELASLVSELVRPHLISIDENEQAALLAAVDAATSDLMRSILHDREFQALEASWRGLYLLVRRAETGTDLKISIFDIPKDELSLDLRSQAELINSRIHKLIAGGCEGAAGREAWTLLLGDYCFASNVDDTAALIRIGKIAAEAGITFISHVRPDILGVTSLAEYNDPSSWDLSAASEAGRLWWALRGIRESEHLAMTMPRVLARLPYGRETDPVETFAFEESGGTPIHDDYLWTNGCFVAGLLLAQTFSAQGWRMSHDFIQNIERLPMHVYDVEGEAVCQPSCEAVLSEHACDLLMGHGLMPIVSFKNSDTARLLRFQSIADPVTPLKGKWH